MGILDQLQSLLPKGKLDVNKRFEKLREAISGTMSNFFMARDRQTDEIVGLKVGDREKVTLFEGRFKGLKKPAEGEIAMGMKHPLIVETLEHGRTTDDLPYLVMEFLEGQGLHTMLGARDSRLNGNRLSIVKQMGEALNYVHNQEVIHRDICPRNFICSMDGESVKLIDFGLSLPAKRDFCQPGNRTGTPVYMSPEVVRRRWTDKRLDIFAFGVSAYHVLTNELPWPVRDATGMAALEHDTVEPIDIFEARPELNQQLGKAVMKCIEAKPDDRPQTMFAFLRTIDDVDSEEEG